MLVAGNFEAALEDAIRQELGGFVQSALKTHKDDCSLFAFGQVCGTVQGLQRALDVIQKIISEEEAREAAR